MKYRLSITVIMLAVVFSCATGELNKAQLLKADDNSISLKYPGSSYIVRSAMGETVVDAADAARFEIVKYFESRISGETTLRQSLKSETSRGKMIEEKLTELDRTIAVSGSREIPGIEIVSSRAVPGTSGYEVWAALSKHTYGEVIEREIKSLDTEIDNRLDRDGLNDLEKAAGLLRTVHLLERRAVKYRDLKLISEGALTQSRERILVGVRSSLDSLIAHELDVGVVFSGGIDEELSDGISAAVSDAGIRIMTYDTLGSALDNNADVIVSAKFSLSERTGTTSISSQVYTIYWADWVLTLNALDPSSREVINTIVISEKTSGRAPAQAIQRMKHSLINDHSRTISAWIYDIIFSPEKE